MPLYLTVMFAALLATSFRAGATGDVSGQKPKSGRQHRLGKVSVDAKLNLGELACTFLRNKSVARADAYDSACQIDDANGESAA